MKQKATQQIKIATAAIKNAAKAKSANVKANVGNIKSVNIKSLPRVIRSKSIFGQLIKLMELVGILNIIKFISKIAKKIIGPYFKIVIPASLMIMVLFKDSFKYILLFNLMVAIYYALGKIFVEDMEFSLEFFVYAICSFISNIFEYFINLIEKVLYYIKGFNDKIHDIFYNANSYSEFKTSLNNNRGIINEFDTYSNNPSKDIKTIVSTDTITENMPDSHIDDNGYVLNKISNNNNLSNNLSNNTSLDNEDELYIPTKYIFIIFGVSVLIIAGCIYSQNPQQYNEGIYNTFKSVKDYLSSFIWDRPDRPGDPGPSNPSTSTLPDPQATPKPSYPNLPDKGKEPEIIPVSPLESEPSSFKRIPSVMLRDVDPGSKDIYEKSRKVLNYSDKMTITEMNDYDVHMSDMQNSKETYQEMAKRVYKAFETYVWTPDRKNIPLPLSPEAKDIPLPDSPIDSPINTGLITPESSPKSDIGTPLLGASISTALGNVINIDTNNPSASNSLLTENSKFHVPNSNIENKTMFGLPVSKNPFDVLDNETLFEQLGRPGKDYVFYGSDRPVYELEGVNQFNSIDEIRRYIKDKNMPNVKSIFDNPAIIYTDDPFLAIIKKNVIDDSNSDSDYEDIDIYLYS